MLTSSTSLALALGSLASLILVIYTVWILYAPIKPPLPPTSSEPQSIVKDVTFPDRVPRGGITVRKNSSFTYTFWLTVNPLIPAGEHIVFVNGTQDKYSLLCASMDDPVPYRVAMPCVAVKVSPTGQCMLQVSFNTTLNKYLQVDLSPGMSPGVIKYPSDIVSFVMGQWIHFTLTMRDEIDGISMSVYANEVAVVSLTPRNYPPFAGNHFMHNEGKLYVFPKENASPIMSLAHMNYFPSALTVKEISKLVTGKKELPKSISEDLRKAPMTTTSSSESTTSNYPDATSNTSSSSPVGPSCQEAAAQAEQRNDIIKSTPVAKSGITNVMRY